MRVIAGTARGRRLVAPPGEATRPMLDHQKEALFNILQSCFPCGGVLDLFAGSGGLGIEALSRGAAEATFVETRPAALRVLRENLRACGFEPRASLLAVDALDLDPRTLTHPAGVVFIDPPFPLFLALPEKLRELGERIATAPSLEPDAVVVLRIPADAEPPLWPASFEQRQRRVLGESLIQIVQRSGTVEDG